MERTWDGDLFTGECAAGRRTRAVLERWELRLDDYGCWPKHAIRHEWINGSVCAFFSVTQPSARFLLRRREARELLTALGIRLNERWRPSPAKLLLLVMANVLLLPILYLSLTPLAYGIARSIPFALEKRFFEGPALSFLSSRECRGADAERSLRELLSHLGKENADVHVVNMDLENAFALPGGKIVLTRGLIAKAGGPDEIAGVLAHELAHVEERHVLGEWLRATFFAGAWALLFGDHTGALVVDPATLSQFASLSFSRDAERRADALGLETLRRAGIGRAGFETFFVRLSGGKERRANRIRDGLLPLLSSHPGPGERLANIRTLPGWPSTRASLSGEAWNALRAACQNLQGERPRARPMNFRSRE